MFKISKPLFLVSIFWCFLLPAKVSLVWQLDRLHTWEEDWLMELFSGLDVTVVDDGKHAVFLDNSIIVSNHTRELETYVKKLHDLGYKFGIILTSDETCNAPDHFYRYAQFVFRNYWREKFVGCPNVVMFPLGYKTKFWKGRSKQLNDVSDRKYTWSFAGRLDHPARAAMISQMRKVPNGFIHQIHEWADKRSLSTKDYRDLMLNTVFIPCAKGCYSYDTFRLYEALECGCIPIVESGHPDYFTQFYGAHPFLTVTSWHEAPKLVSAFLADQQRLERKRQECHDWWVEHKKKVNRIFVETVQSTLDTN